MKLAIMQPYFFPYLGYLALIKQSDYFVFFDTPQFIRHGWINRNRILKPGEGWQYITVPLIKHKRDTSIKNVHIKNSIDWKTRILGQLVHYKNRARYYDEVKTLVKRIFVLDTESIVELNIFTIKQVFNYLGLDIKYNVFSEMGLEIDSPTAPDEWALNIAKAMNAREYINLPGGKDFFNRKKFEKEGINLCFLSINLSDYSQCRKTFEPGLSIIDVLMFNSPESIIRMLDDYTLE